MKFVRGFLDGLKSLLAAIVTAAGCFVPAWYAHMAISAGLAPLWVYGCVAVLVMVASSVVLAFLAKAYRGQSPLKD